MSKTVHDQIAERIARKHNTEYKKVGIDVVVGNKAIEVETKKGALEQGIGQVVKSDKARYLAVNKQNIGNALEVTEGTGIGVMNQMGNIVKKAGRKG